jgi:hypothetical protein
MAGSIIVTARKQNGIRPTSAGRIVTNRNYRPAWVGEKESDTKHFRLFSGSLMDHAATKAASREQSVQIANLNRPRTANQILAVVQPVLLLDFQKLKPTKTWLR